MDLNSFKDPATLERYAFLWSEARLVIAAVALFLGGVPPVVYLFKGIGLTSQIWVLLPLFWIVSGVAAGYLGYMWFVRGQSIFGGKDTLDLAAFAVMVISGLNLGYAGLFDTNIGMSLTPYSIMMPVYYAAGIVYLIAAYQLYRKWNASGKRLFS